MKISNFLWPRDRIDHIARHNITPTEVEEVCFGKSFVLKAKRGGSIPVYYILGQTHVGRYLFCVVIHFPDGNGFPVTARPMSENEKKRFLLWRCK
jgi:hypothetical protein